MIRRRDEGERVRREEQVERYGERVARNERNELWTCDEWNECDEGNRSSGRVSSCA